MDRFPTLLSNSTSATTPWLWWDYAVRHNDHCKMEAGTFTEVCAEKIMADVGIDPTGIARVKACVGDVSADVTNTAG